MCFASMPFKFILLLCAFAFVQMTHGQGLQTKPAGKLVVESSTDGSGRVTKGYYQVYENRETRVGRQIKLDLIVYHATEKNSEADPIFFLAGGPGQGAATVGRGFAQSWMREKRDIVLVNQRGTGGDNRLAMNIQADGEGLQRYLQPLFPIEQVKRSREILSRDFDLTMYSTPIAMDDLNDIRLALGYNKINLIGGSYGTRASLVYLRRHGDSVRTATLNGVAPIEFTNPLYHAESAQRALDLIFDEVESNATYRDRFPGLRTKFAELLKRFDEGPIDVTVASRDGEQTVQLSREAFAGALRVQMYYLDTSRRVPALLWQAIQGDFRPFAESSIRRSRNLTQSLAMGMLLSVTAAEDVARIDPNDIDLVCRNSFLGGSRVRRQIEACKVWPKSKLPKDFGEPVVSSVPTLILSGTIDPVTPPKWGEVVHQNFRNSLHVIAPAAHGVGGPCITKIQRAFLESGSVAELDTECVKQMKLPPLELPSQND